MSQHKDRRSNDDFFDTVQLLGEAGLQSLRLRFQGSFEARLVTWDATLQALDTAGACNFIEVGEDGPGGTRLTIGLRVASIDEATVRKAVIMIRQYKRLRRGRHEW
jgi:hypothetical protein